MGKINGVTADLGSPMWESKEYVRNRDFMFGGDPLSTRNYLERKNVIFHEEIMAAYRTAKEWLDDTEDRLNRGLAPRHIITIVDPKWPSEDPNEHRKKYMYKIRRCHMIGIVNRIILLSDGFSCTINEFTKYLRNQSVPIGRGFDK